MKSKYEILNVFITEFVYPKNKKKKLNRNAQWLFKTITQHASNTKTRLNKRNSNNKKLHFHYQTTTIEIKM